MQHQKSISFLTTLKMFMPEKVGLPLNIRRQLRGGEDGRNLDNIQNLQGFRRTGIKENFKIKILNTISHLLALSLVQIINSTHKILALTLAEKETRKLMKNFSIRQERWLKMQTAKWQN